MSNVRMPYTKYNDGADGKAIASFKVKNYFVMQANMSSLCINGTMRGVRVKSTN